LLRLTCETLKYRFYLEKILDSQNVMRHFLKSKKLLDDRPYCLILVYEIVFGIGIRVADKQIQGIIKSAKKDIMFEHEQLKIDEVSPESLATESKSVDLPRYVRINTLRSSVDTVLKTLKDAGFNLVENAQITDQEMFNEAVQNLRLKDFFFDIHVDKLLVFHPRADLHKLSLVKDKSLILQDKASCLPAFLLKPEPNSRVVDCCAAPGMKTTHLADIMENTGQIWALDRDTNRCKSLSNMIYDSNVKNTTVLNDDFLREDTTSEDYASIEFCLVDAPCSGSGMAKRGDFLQEEVDHKRISGLSNLQSMILKHALKMPNLKRLVYSTCSIHEEENEKVVEEALLEFGHRFEIVDPLLDWDRGIGDYEFSSNCLRAGPQKTLTNGFFVAVFQSKSNSV